MSIKWTERRFSKSLQVQERKDFLARKNSILPSEPLEEMVSCPIHLGIFENPVQLPCGHSFCLDCLERCLRTQMLGNNCFRCPVCRIEWPVPVDGARGWPSSYALNDIIAYVQQQKAAKAGNNSSNGSNSSINGGSLVRGAVMASSSSKRRSSIIEKADVLRKLAEDIETRKLAGAASAVDKNQLIEELNGLLKKLQESPEHMASAGDGTSSRRSSFETRCETELTRRQMSRLCEYRPQKERLSPDAGGSDHALYLLRTSCSSGQAYRDCVDYEEDPAFRRLVYLDRDSGRISLLDCRSGQLESWEPRLRPAPDSDLSGLVQPVFLRLFQDNVYVSGIVSDGEKKRGVLVKFSLDGSVVAQSSAEFEGDSNPVGGFDIDSTGQIYLCLPDRGSVVLLPPDLTSPDSTTEDSDLGHRQFQFQDPPLSPQYICVSGSSNQLWASCPRQQAILILDLGCGTYAQFRTHQLFESQPSHIVCSEDDRVCFLDSRLSRLFWIQKQADYLCIQRLALRPPGELRRGNALLGLRAFRHSPTLLLLSDAGLFTARPVKNVDKKPSQSVNSCCTVM